MAFYYIIKNHVKFGIRHFVGQEDFNMPSSCCAINCVNRCSKKMLMFRFPTDPERKRQWVAAIRREGWQPNEHSRICQEHFIKSMLVH